MILGMEFSGVVGRAVDEGVTTGEADNSRALCVCVCVCVCGKIKLVS